MYSGMNRAIMTGTLLSTPDYSNGDALVEMLSTYFIKKGNKYEKAEKRYLLKIPQWLSKKQLTEGCYVLIDSSIRQDSKEVESKKYEYEDAYLYVNQIKILGEQEREDESSVNIGILYGRLVKDPEVRQMQNGESFVVASLVSNHSEKLADDSWKNDVPDFNMITIFGNQVSFVKKWCKKGMELVCEGSVTTNTSKGTRYISLNVKNIQIGGSAKDNKQFSNEDEKVTPKLPKSSPSKKPESPPPSMSDDFEDDIPF